jgi:hypothetical protein
VLTAGAAYDVRAGAACNEPPYPLLERPRPNWPLL